MCTYQWKVPLCARSVVGGGGGSGELVVRRWDAEECSGGACTRGQRGEMWRRVRGLGCISGAGVVSGPGLAMSSCFDETVGVRAFPPLLYVYSPRKLLGGFIVLTHENGLAGFGSACTMIQTTLTLLLCARMSVFRC
jgi:hypothetical protein